ncbi:MAG: PAS domain S-box protein [Candidatus Falkowbacteria bacterium]
MSKFKKNDAMRVNNEQNLTNFLEVIDDMVFVAQLDGKINYANMAVILKLGYSRMELKKMYILDIHPGHLQKEAKEIFTDMLLKNTNTCPLPLQTKNGQLVPVETKVWFGNWDGQKCIFGVSRDLSAEKEALQKFNKVFELNPLPMALSDAQTGKFLDVNSTFLDKLGFDFKDVVGQTAQNINLFVEPNKQKRIAHELKDGEKINNVSLKVRTKNGSLIDGLFSGEMFESQGKKYLLTVMIDISEQRISEVNLNKSLLQQKMLADIVVELNQYKNFQATINNILKKIAIHTQACRSYIFLNSPDGKTTSNDFEWCASGIMPQKHLLQNISYGEIPSFFGDLDKKGLFVSSDVSTLPKKLKKILESQQIKSILVLPLIVKNHFTGFIGFDQTDVKREWQKSEIEMLQTVAASISSVFERRQNIEDIKIKNEQITRERRKIETIINGIGDGVFVVDRQLNITLFNPVASLLSGYSEKEALGKKYNKILRFAQESSPGKIDEELISRVLSTGEIQFMPSKSIIINKNNEKISITESASPLRNDKDEIIGCVVVFRDATKEREVDKAKSEFVSLASHQLKTPLTGIMWMTELLLKEKLSLNQGDYVNNVNRSAKKLIRLVDDLLNVSHIDTGRKFDIVLEKVDLVALIKDVIADNQVSAEKKGVVFRHEHQLNKMIVNVDPEKFKQVIDNLINNAVKYSKTNGNVTVECRKSETDVVIMITDNGIGIPKNQQNRMFEKFFRADNAAKSATDGTGLGLYIAKSIVEAHEGRIWFESSENHGTTFYVKFSIK